jgi:hypothetical protein
MCQKSYGYRYFERLVYRNQLMSTPTAMPIWTLFVIVHLINEVMRSLSLLTDQ